MAIKDPINPSHYHSEYEWKDFARKWRLFGNLWNFKYLVRAGKKEGVPEAQDWKKFRQFMQFELEYLEAIYQDGGELDYPEINLTAFSKDRFRFTQANKLSNLKAWILNCIFTGVICHDDNMSKSYKLYRAMRNLKLIIGACDIKIKELEAESNGET